MCLPRAVTHGRRAPLASGTERNGTERNGTERNGTERNGTERNRYVSDNGKENGNGTGRTVP